jgi:hypothetical protein
MVGTGQSSDEDSGEESEASTYYSFDTSDDEALSFHIIEE